VIGLGDGRVRLGFEMDHHVQIVRDEIRHKYPPGTMHQR
jgi:sRNA-binding carbon storage regulator CsrA